MRLILMYSVEERNETTNRSVRDEGIKEAARKMRRSRQRNDSVRQTCEVDNIGGWTATRIIERN